MIPTSLEPSIADTGNGWRRAGESPDAVEEAEKFWKMGYALQEHILNPEKVDANSLTAEERQMVHTNQVVVRPARISHVLSMMWGWLPSCRGCFRLHEGRGVVLECCALVVCADSFVFFEGGLTGALLLFLQTYSRIVYVQLLMMKGEFAQAANVCRQILAAVPDHVGALALPTVVMHVEIVVRGTDGSRC